MSDPSIDLLARAEQHIPKDEAARECWGLVVKAIELGWLDREELADLIDHLRDRRDFGVEELLFAHIGDVLRVSFLDERVTCSPETILENLVLLRDSAKI